MTKRKPLGLFVILTLCGSLLFPALASADRPQDLSNELTAVVTVVSGGGGGGWGGGGGVIIVPEPIPGGSATFPDITDHWAKHEIEELATAGVFTGYPDGTFRPDSPMSRGEIAATLTRYLELARIETTPFSDAAGWYQGYIGALSAIDLVKGYPDGTYRPARSITRAELAMVIARGIASGHFAPERKGQATFRDERSFPDWATASIEIAASYGLVLGYEDGTFRPDASITRAEMAAVLHRLVAP